MQTTPLLAVESALSRSNSSSRHDALRRRESGKETDLDGRSGISHILAERERGMAVLKSNLSGQFVGRQASTGWSLPCLDLLDLPSSRAPCTGCPTASR
jgi:hypothetical protein